MHVGHEDPGLRRRNYQRASAELAKVFRMWRDGRNAEGAPVPANRDRREKVPNSTSTTPRMGDMSDSEIDYWARRISAADAEVSINQTNDALGRAKRRAGEAA